MTSFTWLTGVSGDWNTASLWAGTVVPNSATAIVLIQPTGSYTVEIAAGETETVNQLTPVNTGNTVSVDGTLQFAGTLPSSTTQGRGTVLVGASGKIDGTGLFAPGAIVNNGTLAADAGSNAFLELLATVTNNATIEATNGNLEITSLANLSNGTLTGGTYIASGFIPANALSAPDNELFVGLGGSSALTTDAADIVLDGPASLFQVFNASNVQFSLEQELQTIAAGGTLSVLDGRGYQTSNTLLDAGVLQIGGKTLATGGLTIASGGTLAGYGTISGPLTNSGAIIANGGTLGSLILGSAAGGGSVSVAAGSTLIMAGGSASALTAGGLLFDTGSLTVGGAVAGSGTIVVENGGALEIGAGGSAAVSFAGSNVSVQLDAPSQYTGTLTGFGLGDTLDLVGVAGTAAAVVNANTLVVTGPGGTLATVALAGNYTGATFTAVASGGTTVVTNLAGAPARDDMPITLTSVTDDVGLSGSLIAAIEQEVTYAAENWGQYITGAAPLRVSLTFVDGGSFGSELAEGSPGGFIATGGTINGGAVFEPDSLYALQTGNYASGFASDVAITLIASAANLNSFYINPDPSAGTAVPPGKIDLLSVLTHEFGHGLGFLGLANRASPASGTSPIGAGSPIGVYDQFISDSTIAGTIAPTFTGAHAEAAYGQLVNAGSSVPVPLYYSTDVNLSVENFYHLSDSVPALSGDLMETDIAAGAYLPISNLDLAILQDTGVPVTASVQCFMKGTLIRTPDGEVPVEDLRVGSNVTTAHGKIRPVIWTGHRHIDVSRHPSPARVRPVRVAANAFAAGVPDRDLFLSPEHSVYIEGVLIPIRLLLNDSTVTQLDYASVDYYHIELPVHDLVLANGLAAESYFDCGDRRGFTGDSNVMQLDWPRPNLYIAELWEAKGFAPLVLCGAELEAARAHLRGRAVARAA